MVSRTRKIVWTINAQNTRKSIFNYWNKRNKSFDYSKKLNVIFNETFKRIILYPESSISTSNKNIRYVLVRDYYLIFEIEEQEITVLDIWDTRQIPIISH